MVGSVEICRVDVAKGRGTARRERRSGDFGTRPRGSGDVTNRPTGAGAFGVRAWRVTDPAEPALAQALAVDGPSPVDVITQPLPEAHAPVGEWVA